MHGDGEGRPERAEAIEFGEPKAGTEFTSEPHFSQME